MKIQNIKLLIIALILTSCSAYHPQLVYNPKTYTVVSTKPYAAKCVSGSDTLFVRNFDLKKGDKVITLESIPVVKVVR